eukprot:6214363-Pleurochrysis_carterae.AAC.4
MYADCTRRACRTCAELNLNANTQFLALNESQKNRRATKLLSVCSMRIPECHIPEGYSLIVLKLFFDFRFRLIEALAHGTMLERVLLNGTKLDNNNADALARMVRAHAWAWLHARPGVHACMRFTARAYRVPHTVSRDSHARTNAHLSTPFSTNLFMTLAHSRSPSEGL